MDIKSIIARKRAKKELTKDEIKRLIVARIKELFRFKKSPTIDFIESIVL